MRVMVFCSNPVNGGTARVFYETVVGLQKNNRYTVFPCINYDNPVNIYKKIDNLYILPISSAESMFPNWYGGNVIKRMINSIRRNKAYRTTLKENIKNIISFIREQSIDTVIIHNGGYVGDDLCNQVLAAAYQCKDQTKKRIYILHSDMDKNFLSKLRFKKYDETISKEATEIVTVSEFTRNRIQSSSYIKQKIQVIYNGINVKNSLSVEEKKRRMPLDRKNKILMIGNFLENKGQIKFIEVAAKICRENQNYQFVIVGNVYDEEYYKKCYDLVKKYELEEYFNIYTGINNASEYIELFDIMVVPSLYDESFGLISVEAMASGVPVVAFACGGIPEVVKNDEDGFVVPIGDVDSMADKIKELTINPEKRKSISEMCKQHYKEKFSVEAMMERYINLIENDKYFDAERC